MNLEEARSAIEEIDRDIVALIVKRQEYSTIIAGEKKKSGSSVRDEVQRRKVMDRAAVLASESGLDEESIVKIFDTLIEMNEKTQKNYI
jgi:chorismate mutase